jgi:hypothetical protein
MAVDKNISPKDCGRWDTIPGVLKVVNKPTGAQKKFIDQFNAERAAAAKKKAAKKK